ncbi:MAG TPA: FAD-dependent oxidoreductase, partial [Puia sp.]|nr:FAD-dependent oxidoreductase [Puia sp.]
MASVAVIGAGFSGLSAAAYLAYEGHEVSVFEKHTTAGGRARQMAVPEGYVFDMGPSWYWMPDVFDRFFADFGSSTADHYRLTLLDPGFEVVFEKESTLLVPDEFDRLKALFEGIEPGSALRLDRFMQGAQYKYETAMQHLIYSPGLSLREFLRAGVLRGAWSLQLLTSLRRHVRKYFRDPRLVSLMEFPVLFLGGSADQIPALYSLMNYAGLRLGTWYPRGGFGKVVSAVAAVGEAAGARFFYNSPIERISVSGSLADGVVVNGTFYPFDAVVAAADYHHV